MLRFFPGDPGIPQASASIKNSEIIKEIQFQLIVDDGGGGKERKSVSICLSIRILESGSEKSNALIVDIYRLKNARVAGTCQLPRANRQRPTHRRPPSPVYRYPGVSASSPALTSADTPEIHSPSRALSRRGHAGGTPFRVALPGTQEPGNPGHTPGDPEPGGRVAFALTPVNLA